MGHITLKQVIIDYLQRCEGGRRLQGLEYCLRVEVHSLEKNLSASKEKILK